MSAAHELQHYLDIYDHAKWSKGHNSKTYRKVVPTTKGREI